MEPASKLLIAAGTAVGAALGSILLRNHGTKAMLDRIDEAFPGSLTNAELVDRVYEKLSQHAALSSSGKKKKKKKKRAQKQNVLLCTSLCSDEIVRGLERDFAKVYGDDSSSTTTNDSYYTMGGLAGFPWGGTTAFASMASRIPPNGTALLVFGPHVGVDDNGHLGTVPRRGRDGVAGPCCEAAVAASPYVTTAKADGSAKMMPSAGQDAEQTLLCNALLPYAERIDQSSEPMVELPYSLYDAQKEMITNIVKAGCGAIPDHTHVAVLGGIQINTPPGVTDYFIPLSFELYDKTGTKVDDLTL